MNKEKFKKQVLPIKDKLYRMAVKMLADPIEAQDAVQEVLIKLWDQRKKLSSIINLEAWAIRMTKNHCLDRLRSKHRRTEELDINVLAKQEVAPADKGLEQLEILNKIRSLMNRLPEQQKLVMHLREIEGFSYREISNTLDLTEDQVKINLFRARKKMRAFLLKTVSYE